MMWEENCMIQRIKENNGDDEIIHSMEAQHDFIK